VSLSARLAVLVVLATAVLAGALYSLDRIRAPRYPDLGFAPAFTLADSRGDSLGVADLRGKVWAVDFMFTRCRGICPILARRMLSLQDALAEESGWALVSISVDPEHDRPDTLAAYADRIGAGNNWHFLTGEKDYIFGVVEKGFLLPVKEQPGNEKEPVLHSGRIMLVDRDGRFRGIYDSSDDEDMEALEKQAVQLIRQGAS